MINRFCFGHHVGKLALKEMHRKLTGLQVMKTKNNEVLKVLTLKASAIRDVKTTG